VLSGHQLVRAYASDNANDAVVSSEWVRENVDKVKVIDASWALGKRAGQHAVKVPGAVFFDIDEIADKKTWLPHMLPTTSLFAAKMDELGITNDDQLLVYDESDGQFVASARVWWTFRVFGHHNVKVLAGGLKNWPRDLQVQKTARSGSKFTVRKDPELVWSKYDMLDNLAPTNDEKTQIVDARSRERFYGLVDEPRADIPRGSIPESVNVPFGSLFQTIQNEQGEPVQVGAPSRFAGLDRV
jgi:thiosulfate/3-mercaptopyruvate sulfurtransferase